MGEHEIPQAVSVPLDSLVTLAVEQWRLAVALASGAGGGAARHALRRIEDLLRRCELQAVPLDGKPFDPGMAVRVVDTIEDPGMPDGTAIIEETVSPMVLWRGQVVRPAEVVTRKGTGR